MTAWGTGGVGPGRYWPGPTRRQWSAVIRALRDSAPPFVCDRTARDTGGERCRPARSVSAGPVGSTSNPPETGPSGRGAPFRPWQQATTGCRRRGSGYSAAMIASNSARIISSSRHSPRRTPLDAVSLMFTRSPARLLPAVRIMRRGAAGSAGRAARSGSCGAWPSRPPGSATSEPHRRNRPGPARYPRCPRESAAD